MKRNIPSLSACASVCALLMLVLLICQFLPFWNTGTQTVSIGSYIWFPSENGDVSELLQPHTESKFPINDIVTPCVLMLLFSVGTLLLWIFSRENVLLPVCSLIGSAAGIWVCIMKAAFRLGELWLPILILSMLGTVVSLLALYLRYRRNKCATD